MRGTVRITPDWALGANVRNGAHLKFEGVTQAEAHETGQFIFATSLDEKVKRWMQEVMRISKGIEQMFPGCGVVSEGHDPYLVARGNNLCAAVLTCIYFGTTHKNIGQIVDFLEKERWAVEVPRK